MKHLHHIIIALTLLLAAVATPSAAQTDRQLIRQGNRAYRAQKYVEAETQYRKAVSKNQKNPQAAYNLGCALLAQQKDSLAIQQFANAAQMETNKLRRATSYHNAGVVMQGHREYAQAIDFYKAALRCNPADNETRYNLALCKKLLKDNKQNKNDKNKKDDKNKDQNKDKKDKDKKDGNGQNDKNKDNKDKNQDKQQNRQNQDQMSRDNAEQLLNAAIQQEQATKQKLQKAMRQARSKNYEKNW